MPLWDIWSTVPSERTRQNCGVSMNTELMASASPASSLFIQAYSVARVVDDGGILLVVDGDGVARGYRAAVQGDGAHVGGGDYAVVDEVLLLTLGA